MKTLHFEGCSDDTFGEYALTNEDHDNCASSERIQFLVTAGGESLVVTGQYCPGACGGWSIGVGHHLETDADEQHLPAWPMRLERSERPYSPRLVIEAPDDVTVKHLERRARQ